MKGKKIIFIAVLALILSLVFATSAFAADEDIESTDPVITADDSSVIEDGDDSLIDGDGDDSQNDGDGDGSSNDVDTNDSLPGGDGDDSSDNEDGDDSSIIEDGETDDKAAYTVEFTMDGKQYVMDGNTTVDMAEVLSALGIEGEVADAVGTADSLFAPAKGEDGTWTVSANNAFKSTQGMTVTMADGTVYEIVVTDDGTVCVKDGGDGSKTYYSITEAITQGTTNIVLTGDVTESVTVADKTITIDLNGFTWKSAATAPGGTYALMLNGNANVTILDSSAAGTGTIIARGLQTLNTGNTLTIESGKIVADGGSNGTKNGGACVWNNAGNALVINGGTFETTSVGTPSDTYGSGCVYNEGTATITGGTFTSVNRRTYAVISKSSITIDPAEGKTVTVSGAHGALAIDAGTAVVNGGSFSSTEYYGLYVSNDGKGGSPETAAVTVNGGTFSGKEFSVWVGSDHNNPVNSTISITGGSFEKPLNAQENAREGAIVVSGGTFSSEVPAEFCADDFKCEKNADGRFGVTPKVYIVQVLDSSNAVTGQYETLQAAITAAASGEKVVLLKDVTETVTVTKDLTIDLGGKTLNGGEYTFSDGSKEFRALTAYAGTVTVQNGAISGRVNVYDASNVTIAANVTIENRPLNGNDAYGISVWGDGTYGEDGCKTPTLNLYGKVNVTGSSFGVCTNGTDMSKPVINIYDGAEITGEIAVYLPSGALTVYGGALTGKTALYFKSTDLDIRGGTFTGNGASEAYVHNGNGANATGDAVVIESCGYPAGVGTVSISGGTFISENAAPVASYVKSVMENTPVTEFVSGGSFSGEIPTNLCADGFRGVENEDGSYDVVERQAAKIGDTVYASLQQAIDAAHNGDRIVMIEDADTCPDCAEIPEGLEITIDLNGRELYCPGGAEISNRGKLTLIDSSEDQEGEIWGVENLGELTINGGLVRTLSTIGNGKTVVNDGDVFYLDTDGEIQGELTINGGIFAFNPSEYVDENAVVTRLQMQWSFGDFYTITQDGYAVNHSNEVWADSMDDVAGADEGTAVFTIVKAPENDAEITIENFSEELRIVNETEFEIVLNGRVIPAGADGYLADFALRAGSGFAKYFVIEGADQEWTKGSEDDVEIRLNSNAVLKVLIGEGKEAEEVEFTVEADGTVTIETEVLEALEKGQAYDHLRICRWTVQHDHYDRVKTQYPTGNLSVLRSREIFLFAPCRSLTFPPPSVTLFAVQLLPLLPDWAGSTPLTYKYNIIII